MTTNEMIEPQPKKRGRRKKEEPVAQVAPPNDGVNITITIEENETQTQNESVAKKRGRKPKGGKLIVKHPEKTKIQTPIANIILHLKCSMQDLNEHNNELNKLVSDPLSYNPVVPPSILTYNTNDKTKFSSFDAVADDNTRSSTIKDAAYNDFDKVSQTQPSNTICQVCLTKIDHPELDTEADISIKDVNIKLKKLKIQLYKNVNCDKKSACFWCTYEYDNPSCYIPKYEMDAQIYGYGSFCRPECAVAYLMKENIDDSMKFERYHLLNQIYSKVYDYKKSIKPAPNPYFLLDKFYGNLTIQEYRKLLKSEHMLLVIDKPLSRILPELHEDNDEFTCNIFGLVKTSSTTQNGGYKVKRESEKQKAQSKSSIIKERFGLSQ
jgi:CRISPR/Cas system CSM-associated protein Csm2 small subunit